MLIPGLAEIHTRQPLEVGHIVNLLSSWIAPGTARLMCTCHVGGREVVSCGSVESGGIVHRLSERSVSDVPIADLQPRNDSPRPRPDTTNSSIAVTSTLKLGEILFARNFEKSCPDKMAPGNNPKPKAGAPRNNHQIRPLRTQGHKKMPDHIPKGQYESYLVCTR